MRVSQLAAAPAVFINNNHKKKTTILYENDHGSFRLRGLSSTYAVNYGVNDTVDYGLFNFTTYCFIILYYENIDSRLFCCI